jgi:hypothetical protein
MGTIGFQHGDVLSQKRNRGENSQNFSGIVLRGQGYDGVGTALKPRSNIGLLTVMRKRQNQLLYML